MPRRDNMRNTIHLSCLASCLFKHGVLGCSRLNWGGELSITFGPIKPNACYFNMISERRVNLFMTTLNVP